MDDAVLARQTSNRRVSTPPSLARRHRTRLFSGAAWRRSLRGARSAPMAPISNRQTARI